MGKTPIEIEREIEANRNELGRDLHEIEYRIYRASNWRARFRKQPLKMMGIAFGGGLLLSMMTSRSFRYRPCP